MSPKRRLNGSPQETPAASSSKGASGPAEFPVVGIGASAGGLEAFTELLRFLPEKTGMALVLVQHLDPTHRSALSEILSRATKIPVTEVTDGVRIEPDHIYVIPANTTMLIEDGALRLAARHVKRGLHMPVDEFLQSLAEDRKDSAIGVILSGTASDGTEGCLAIRAAGGITIAQDERSARFTSMPSQAIRSGCVDLVLPPKGIARELVRLGKHPYVARPAARELTALAGSASQVQALLALLREGTGVDFSQYKKTTLERRIKRRMVLHQIEKVKDYVGYIEKNPAEIDLLYGEMLIHVTGFFRDKEAFDTLAKVALPTIFQNRKRDEGPARIWVPGCSTGEEVYSIAIAVLEYLSDQPQVLTRGSLPTKAVQMFASDISEVALEKARNGVYSGQTIKGVSSERLKRFFLPMDGGYQINKSLREMCIFAKQNIAKDPPFSNLDLVSCRNLLIYLSPALQNRVIPTIHYALRPDGFLMLGTSETLGGFADHFLLVDKKYKIYQKKRTGARLVPSFARADYAARKHEPLPAPKSTHSPVLTLEREVERVLANRYVPASIVVSGDMEIVHFRGRLGRYLEPAPGHPTFSVAKMAREGLLVDLRDALNRAKKENGPVRKDGVRFRSNGDTKTINLEVTPIRADAAHDRSYLVVFEDVEEARAAERRVPKGKARASRAARDQERADREVKRLREQLQALIEDHETALEEYKSANEEVLSANEELQSINEEMETAKEELQSSNEELTTLNEELANRNAEMTVANNDLLNLFGSVNLPVLMVGNDLRVRRFTPPAQALLNLLPADIGRRLGEIRPNIDAENLEKVAQQTIETATLLEREVRENGGGWYQMRVRPYKTVENKIDGAVLTFQDIDAMKGALDQTRLYADSVIANARAAILVLDAKLRVAVANRAFYGMFQLSPQQTEGVLVYELGGGQLNFPGLRQMLEEVLARSTRVDDFEARCDFPEEVRRILMLNAQRIGKPGEAQMILLSMEDVTEKRDQYEAVRQQATLLDLAYDAVLVRDMGGKISFWNKSAEDLYGWGKEEAIGKIVHTLLRTEFPEPEAEIDIGLLRTGRWEGTLVHTTRGGERKQVLSRWALQRDDRNQPLVVEVNSDITRRKQFEDRVREISGRLLTVQDTERRRIARDLHDSTGQKLAVLTMLLQSLKKGATEQKLKKVLSECLDTIRDAANEIRTVAQLLHPPALDETGLVSAIRWLAEGFSQRSGIEVEFAPPEKFERPGPDAELTFFRVAQESLSNIHRHSGAKKAKIKLHSDGDSIVLEITDNGKGLPDGASLDGGNETSMLGVGVMGMKQRLDQLGGKLEIFSNGKGTTVRASAPRPALQSEKAAK